MKRRLLAMLLVFAMTLSVCPVNAFALDVPTVLKSGEIPFQVNPLYADVLEASDFDQPERKPGIPANGSDADYLTEDQVIDQVREAMKSRVGEITVHVQTTETDLTTLAKDIFYGAMEHTGDPEEGDYLKWHWGGYNVAYGYYTEGGITYINYSYNVVYYTTQEQEAELDGAIAELLASPELDGADDYEKIRFFYDYICNNIVYDYENLEDDAYKLKFSAYAAMVNGTAVCQGYAQLLYRLALSVGVDARLIAGIGNGGGHAWNIIRLDGLYYNVDSTWDAPRAEQGMEYEYFLTTDANFGDHARYEEYATESFYAEYPMGATDYVHQENTEPGDAVSGTCGENLTWVLTNDGTLTISGEGAMTDFVFDDYKGQAINQPWYDYRNKITSVVIESGVTHVGDYAFNYFEYLRNVSLPSGLVSIGAWAFYGCDLDCLNIPATVAVIENMAFRSSMVLEDLYIEDLAAWCAIDFPDHYTSTITNPLEHAWNVYIDGVLTSEVEIPAGVTKVGDYTFYGAPFNSVTIPETVTVVGAGAFGFTDVNLIVFCGDAPAFEVGKPEWTEAEVGAFEGSAFTVRYPANNATWTADVMQNYGGTITWEPYETSSIVSGTCGENLTWSFDEATGVLTISGEGDMIDFDQGNEIPWGDYLQSITSVVIEEGVTSVGNCAFAFCSMSALTLPETLTDIGVAAFAYTMNLTGVDLPGSLVTIGDEAFGISGLTEVTIPASVETIGARAFVCPLLTAIHVEDNNANYYSWDGLLYGNGGTKLIQVPGDYTGVLHLHDLTQVIGEQALLYCEEVTELVIPASVYEIGQNAFSNCTSLTQIRFLGNVPGAEGLLQGVLPENLFDGMTLTVSYPDANPTWTEEAKQIFGGTITWNTHGENLVATGYCGETSFMSEDGAEIIRGAKYAVPGENATWTLDGDGTMTVSGTGRMADCMLFAGIVPWVNVADRITKVVVEEGITYVGHWSFTDILGTNITEVSLSSTVEKIGAMAFAYMPALKTVHLAEGLTKIGHGAFGEATSLSEIVIPASVTTIGESAFYHCISLTGLEIPAAVTEIGPGAFAECTGLTEIRFRGDAPSIAEDVLTNVTATAYYPASNATWTADVMQNYGGTITWEAYGIPAVTSGVCGDTATWSFDEATGILTVSGTGAIYDYEDNAAIENRPWQHLKDQITKIVIEDGITVIGMYAFFEFKALETVIFSDTVTEINGAAFANCFELVDMTLPANLGLLGDDVFYNCERLEEVDIPASVYCVGGSVFAGCSSLTSVIFRADPNSNLGSFTLGNAPFRWCYALEEIQVEEGHFALRSVDGCLYSGEAFMQYPHGRQDRELVIAEGTKTIFQLSLSETRYLEKITMPASVELLDFAFYAATSLKEITFEGNAPAFAEDEFSGCTLTIRYPENDPTWTADVMQNYGGTITWVPYTRYEIIEEGTDEVVVEGEELTIHIEADHTTLVAVYLDGELVDPANYTVTEGSTIITFKPEFLATLGEGEHKVTAEFEGGTADATIKVQDYMPGDINGDGKVNNKDLTRLFQYLSNWEVEVVDEALDVNGDGKTNNKDLTRLFQYLSNWDVEIH